MKPFLLSLCLIAVSTQTVSADRCPAAPDHSAGLNQLIQEIQKVQTEGAARDISGQMWGLWADAPNEQAQAILDQGMSKRSSWDLTGALQDFNRLVEYCPDYAEGYNQRAFVHFLRHDFASALTDLDRAIVLSPKHIAALSGRALSLMGLGRTQEARDALIEALALNPWLPERGLIDAGGRLAPTGEEI
ncbi:tetratricopeptide repeat protein [Phaeobacter sp. NW0010-22]|uniref:tetratricopeptide repeat protein n=1 Tax=Phaeobacter sp. NW0010-22 TaxID=3135907 RepID=UPI00333F8CEB